MKSEIIEFSGRRESIVWKQDERGNHMLCPAGSKDMSECVGENIVDMTYSRGG